MMKVYSAQKIFTGSNWLIDHSILVENGLIKEVFPSQHIPANIAVQSFADCFIAPAFIDIQLYGASGNLFSVKPTIETLQKINEHCLSGGTKQFVPTVATNMTEVFKACIDAVRLYWEQDRKGVLGLHVEGPWINKIKRGAHIESLMHSPTEQEVKELLEYGKDVIIMITIAPEVCSDEIVSLIQSYNVIVSAGHSNATFEEATNAFNNGINAATHLYNAMSGLQHREPGLVGAIMHHPTVMSSVVPDGFHVDFAAISIAKNVMGERLFIITDAVTETSEGPYPHQLDGDKYVANGILSGSALTMIKAVKNCVDKAGIELDEALRMASLYPAKVLGLDNELGKIERGSKADFVVLSNDLEVITCL